MLAQELCGATVKRTMLVDIVGIYPPSRDGDVRAERMASMAGGYRLQSAPSPPSVSSSAAAVWADRAPRPVMFLGDFVKYSTKPLAAWNILWDW
jgi:hypothetical protein